MNAITNKAYCTADSAMSTINTAIITGEVDTVNNQAYCSVNSATRLANAVIITGEVDTVNNQAYWPSTAAYDFEENVYQEILN